MIKSIRTTERNTLMLHELEYPFDSEYILKKSKSLKRRLLEENTQRIPKKIAVLWRLADLHGADHRIYGKGKRGFDAAPI